MSGECKHLKAYIRMSDKMGYATCPDCGQVVMLYEVFNNLLNEMRKALGIDK